MREDLRIVGKLLDHAQPLLDIPQRRNAAHALAHVLGSGRAVEQRVEIALRKEMRVGVDRAHSLPPALSTSCPRLARASTSVFVRGAVKDVDGRDISAFTRVFN